MVKLEEVDWDENAAPRDLPTDQGRHPLISNLEVQTDEVKLEEIENWEDNQPVDESPTSTDEVPISDSTADIQNVVLVKIEEVYNWGGN